MSTSDWVIPAIFGTFAVGKVIAVLLTRRMQRKPRTLKEAVLRQLAGNPLIFTESERSDAEFTAIDAANVTGGEVHVSGWTFGALNFVKRHKAVIAAELTRDACAAGTNVVAIVQGFRQWKGNPPSADTIATAVYTDRNDYLAPSDTPTPTVTNVRDALAWYALTLAGRLLIAERDRTRHSPSA